MPTIIIDGETHDVPEAVALELAKLKAAGSKRNPRVTHDGHHLIDIPPCPKGCSLTRQMGTVAAGPSGTNLAVVDWQCSCGAEWQTTHPVVVPRPAPGSLVRPGPLTPNAYLAAGDVLYVRAAPPRVAGVPHYVIHKNLTEAELAKLTAREGGE